MNTATLSQLWQRYLQPIRHDGTIQCFPLNTFLRSSYIDLPQVMVFHVVFNRI
jgi:hypothetical protein